MLIDTPSIDIAAYADLLLPPIIAKWNLLGDLDEGLESWLAAEGRTAREVCHDGRLATYTVHVYQCPAAG